MEAIYKKLAEFGSLLLEKRTLVEGLPFITKYAKDILKVDRVSVFVYDKHKNSLWTIHADGIEKIVIPVNKGIAGEAFLTNEPIIENDVAKSPFFLPDIDVETGYNTKNILALPIPDASHKPIGILELLNKNGGFSQKDLPIAKLFAQSLSSFIKLVIAQEQ